MKDYLDSLEDMIKRAPDCKTLQKFALEAIESLEKGISDATTRMTKLQPLMTPPAGLPGVIIWIKAQIDLYAVPFETYLKQIAEYTARLEKIQQAISDKANALACGDIAAVIPKVPGA
jgi:hypothetical protein